MKFKITCQQELVVLDLIILALVSISIDSAVMKNRTMKLPFFEDNLVTYTYVIILRALQT